MGKYLTKREFEYKSGLFEALGINKKDAVGKNFEQLSQLIGKKYRILSLKCHPDKNGDSDEKMKALTSVKSSIASYIIPSKLNGNLIFVQENISFSQEHAQIVEAMKHGREVEFSKHYKAHMFYNVGIMFIGLLQITSIIYLTVKFFQNIQPDLKNILFGIGLAGFVTTIIASSLLMSHLNKISGNLQKEAQEKSETLEIDDFFLGLEKKLKENKKYSILNTALKYLMPLSIVTMAASLVVESALNNFKTVDTKLLINYL